MNTAEREEYMDKIATWALEGDVTRSAVMEKYNVKPHIAQAFLDDMIKEGVFIRVKTGVYGLKNKSRPLKRKTLQRKGGKA